MILGLGIDIVDIRRIEKSYKKYGERFLKKIFSDGEIKAADKYGSKKKWLAHFAKRFAAKEAVAKALGSGIGKDISFKDAVVSNLESGKPSISLIGQADKKLKLLSANSIPQIDISLSDDYPIAQAIVIISAV